MEELPKQIREIHAGSSPKLLPGPRAGVDVEQLMLAVPWIAFEL
jgi:hypothetical protein